MSPQEREELAALHALDLLEGEELAAFRQEMAHDSKLPASVEEYRAASHLMAKAVPQYQPPSYLREMIVRAYTREKVPAQSAPPTRRGFLFWPPWIVAAGLAIYCGVLLADKAHLGQDLAEARQNRAALEIKAANLSAERNRLQSRVSDLEAERNKLQISIAALQKRDPLAGIRTVALAPQANTSATGTAVAAWDTQQQTGTLNAAQLPAPEAGKDYQLWIIPPSGAPISAGVIANPGAGNIPFQASQPVPQVGALAISLEPKGGSQSPTGPVVYLGKM